MFFTIYAGLGLIMSCYFVWLVRSEERKEKLRKLANDEDLPTSVSFWASFIFLMWPIFLVALIFGRTP